MKRALLWCGVVGAAFFVLAFLIEGATRSGYDPMRHPVSSLALGDFGWTQTVNFLITGMLFVAFAIGLRGEGIWLPILVSIVGIGLIGAGLFATDPVNGYPPGAPSTETDGSLHGLFSLLVFFGLPVACGVGVYRFAKARRTGWAIYSGLTGVAFLVCFVLAGAGFSGENATFTPIGGLMQRITIVLGWAWLAAIAVDRLKRVPR